MRNWRLALSCGAMSKPGSPLALEQSNIVVRDMQPSLAFYRLLGVSIEETLGAERAEWARHDVNGTTSKRRARRVRSVLGRFAPRAARDNESAITLELGVAEACALRNVPLNFTMIECQGMPERQTRST